MSNLRENLLYLREQRGMSQSQLAARLDVSRQSVAKWEAEKSYPEMEKLIKICDIFGCSMDDLVRGDLTASAGEAAEEEYVDAASGASDPELSHQDDTARSDSTTLPIDAAKEGVTPVYAVAGSPAPKAVHCQPKTAAQAEGCSWVDFDAYMKRRARTLSLSALFLAGGFSAEFFAEAVQLDLTGEINQLGPVLLMICVALSAVLGLAAHRSRVAFIARNGSVRDSAPEEEALRGHRRRSVYLSLLLTVAIVIAPSFVPGLDGKSAYASAAYWLTIAVAAGLLVNSLVCASALDTDRYNRTARRFLAKKDRGYGRET